jgi:hypothetical protein
MMMGIIIPETCWTVSVRQSNKISRLIVATSWVFYFSDWRCTEPQTQNWCLTFRVHILVKLVSKLYWNCLLTHKIMRVFWLLTSCIWEFPSSGILGSVTTCLFPHVCRPFSGLVYIGHYTVSKHQVTNNESQSAISQKKGVFIQKKLSPLKIAF